MKPRQVKVLVRPIAGMWAATAPSEGVTVVGDSYLNAMEAFKDSLAVSLAPDDVVQLAVTVYEID